MSLAIVVGRNEAENKAANWFIHAWRQALLNLDPQLDIRLWPDIGDPTEVDFVLAWNHPLGALKQFTKAKAIYSLAAGVDHVLIDPDLDHHIPIVRIIDPYMANDIVQYVVAYVLQQIKLVHHWRNKQEQKIWFKEPPFNLAEKTIGIMGLGHLGGKAANLLHQLGLHVNGWSQSAKDLPGITQFIGEAEWNTFLTQTHLLVCMLPLTSKTKNILNRDTFSQLPKAAYVINVGRGQHLVEEDLLAALESGQLSGACLDVFQQEPLPVSHPFWIHPKIQVTPHIASVTNPITAAPQIYENYQRSRKGLTLLNRVDYEKGY